MAQQQQAQYESKVADRNAALVENQKSDAWQRRNIDQLRLWRHVTQQLGEQRASAAAGGLDVNFGSVADLQLDTLSIGEEDSSVLNQNTIKEVHGFDIEQANYRDQSAAAKARGHAAMVGGILGATGTLLSAAAQVGKTSFGPSGGGGGGFTMADPYNENLAAMGG